MKAFIQSFVVAVAVLMTSSVFSGTVTINTDLCGDLTGNMTVAANGDVVITTDGDCGTPTANITLTSTGSGGQITSNLGGMVCRNTTCVQSFLATQVVILTAEPDLSETFLGWVGCDATPPPTTTCTLDMSQGSKTVSASFSGVVTHALNVTKAGTGSNGVVTSDVAGINCGVDCTEPYPDTTPVVLTATPGADTFTGWSGDCTGTGTCSLTMNGVKNVTANFTAPVTSFSLNVARNGTGSGTVTSVPSGINCGATCTASLSGSVTLSAVASGGSSFAGWAGGCTGTGSCALTMDAVKNVTATFNADIGNCPTLPNVNILNAGTWPVINSQTITMAAGVVTAIPITTTADGNLRGQFATVPTSTNGSWHTAAINSCPGVFSDSLGVSCIREGSETVVNWKQQVPQLFNCGLAPNTTYYVNIGFRTIASSANTCTNNTGSCAVIVQNYPQ